MAYTTIDKPTDYFETKLYSGSGSASNITGVGFQPDWVWIKCRTNAVSHSLNDSVRGANKQLESNDNGAETSFTNALTSFNSDGFTVDTSGETGQSGRTYVSWNWKKTATAGFDIVSYTGNGSNRTISHSLSAVPKMMIVKNRDASEEWTVYHAGNTSAPATDYLALNTNGATTDSNNRWNDTLPTSSVFTVGTSGVVNANGQKFIAYLFSEKKGYSKFGSYTGNGNADGTFVYTGFKPAWVMWKRTDATNDWYIYDNKRNSFNTMGRRLEANQNDDEVNSGSAIVDFVSNGYKFRGTDSSWNVSGGTFIYMAFAEESFVSSTGVPATAK